MKKGFTLIELLAVIVILAIIALIATPIVLSIISDSKESAQLRSAEMYLDAVTQSISLEKIKNTNFRPSSCDITNDGNLYCNDKYMIKVEVKGEKPIDGNIAFEEGNITDIILKYENSKIIIKDENGNLVYFEYNNGLVHNLIIPTGGVYTASNGTVYNEGDSFPLMVSTGDFYTYNNYKYLLCRTEDGAEFGSEEEAMNAIEFALKEEGITMEEFLTSQGFSTLDELMQALHDNGIIGSEKAYYFEVSVIDNSAETFGNILKTINGINITKLSDDCFKRCENLESFEVPGFINEIGSDAFYECNNLVSINIADSVTSIGDWAFYGCDKLKQIKLSNSLEKINRFLLYGCSSLEAIIIPDSVTYIEEEALGSCSNLKTIFIPKSVTNIYVGGGYSYYSTPFIYCSADLKVYCELTESEAKSEYGTIWMTYNRPYKGDYGDNTAYYLNVTYGITRSEYEALIVQ